MGVEALAKQIARELFDDMSGRRGFRTADVDEETKTAWLAEWEAMVAKRLQAAEDERIEDERWASRLSED